MNITKMPILISELCAADFRKASVRSDFRPSTSSAQVFFLPFFASLIETLAAQGSQELERERERDFYLRRLSVLTNVLIAMLHQRRAGSNFSIPWRRVPLLAKLQKLPLFQRPRDLWR